MTNVRTASRSAAAIARLAGLVGVAGIAVAGLAAPASAEGWDKRDPARDARHYADIVRVQADHEPKNLWVRTTYRETPYDYTNVMIDTDRSRPGAEFQAEGYLAWDGPVFSLRRLGSGYRPCADGRTVRLNRRQLQVRIPRACLRTDGAKPRQVRIRVQSLGEEFYWVHDAVPGKKLFGPWLSVG